MDTLLRVNTKEVSGVLEHAIPVESIARLQGPHTKDDSCRIYLVGGGILYVHEPFRDIADRINDAKRAANGQEGRKA